MHIPKAIRIRNKGQTQKMFFQRVAFRPTKSKRWNHSKCRTTWELLLHKEWKHWSIKTCFQSLQKPMLSNSRSKSGWLLDSLRSKKQRLTFDLSRVILKLSFSDDGYTSTFSSRKRRIDLSIDRWRINFDWSSPSSQVPGPLHSRPSKLAKIYIFYRFKTNLNLTLGSNSNFGKKKWEPQGRHS